jgi:glutathione S-transferase
VRVDLRNGTLADGTNFRSINPLGYVPMLMFDDGRWLLENSAILLYIADLVPARQLALANSNPFLRYKLLERLNFIATELHKRFLPLFAEAPEAIQTETRTQLAALFAWLDQQLLDNDYQFGAAFTVADVYLYVILSWTSHTRVGLDDFDHLRAFQARVADRPATQRALALEKQ